MADPSAHTSGPSGGIFEKFGVKHLLFQSSVMVAVSWLVLFYPLYFHPRPHLLPFLGFYSSYVFTFLMLFVAIFVGLSLAYRHKALQMELFSDVDILGIKPFSLVTRTGVARIDYVGLVLGICFSLLALLLRDIRFIFPFFLFLSLSFFFAILTGSSKKWRLKKRERF